MSGFQPYADALAEIQRLFTRSKFIHAGCAGLREKDNAHLLGRAEAAEAKVARAQKVCDELAAVAEDLKGVYVRDEGFVQAWRVVAKLRAALEDRNG